MGLKFEKLEVWQRALDFTVAVHELTLSFPKAELFILTSQIKRAADSIVLNIAEGSTGQTNAEFSKFLGYAVRSGIEVVACLHIAKKRQLVNEEGFASLYVEAQIIIKMAQALRNAVNKSVNSP
jgi:four helix bundle protein